MPLLWPPHLKERLDIITAEFDFSFGKGLKLQLIEMSSWKEAILHSGSEPAPPETPFPPSLLDKLDVVWRDHDHFEPEQAENQMIDTIKQWRESKYKQRIEIQSNPIAVPEELIQKARSPEHQDKRSRHGGAP